MKRVMFYLAFVAAMPLVPILVAGRIAFFGGWALWEVACAWARPVFPPRVQPRVWPFWLAWFVAILCLAAAIAGVVVALRMTADWPNDRQWTAFGLAGLFSIGALFMAYRAALAGTRSLQRALAGNLAMLVAFELDQLRCAAEQRAQLIHVASQVAGVDAVAARLPVPAFFAEREEIRHLLGEPTERVLVDLLNSLHGFNLALAAGDRPLRVPRSDLEGHLSVVSTHLGRALSSLAPYLRQAVS